MTPLYTRPKAKEMPFAAIFKRLLIIATILWCACLQSFTQELIFKNPALESGVAGQNGAIYRFPHVIAGIDALVQIKGRSSSNVVLQDIDVPNEGLSKAFQPQLGRTGNVPESSEWWMEFDIRFVKANMNQDAHVNNFNITALDIDGDGSTIKEYVEFYRTKACFVESNTQLTAMPLGNNGGEKDYRFTGPVQSFLNIDTSSTSVMATAKYENKSRVKFRVGGQSIGFSTSNAGMRYNALWFRFFNYASPSTLPVKLSAFNAALVNKRVVLSWTTDQEKNASHFTVQRSTNGLDFTDAGIIFTEGNSDISRSYSFKDPVSTNTKGILYYRLKMVDLDGKYNYSSIRLVKLGESDGKLALQAFPNPVVNELRITIPESWQNNQVTYELYTGNGKLLKRFINNSATQTETIDMQFCQPGSYVVKALSDKETATHRVIKTR